MRITGTIKYGMALLLAVCAGCLLLSAVSCTAQNGTPDGTQSDFETDATDTTGPGFETAPTDPSDGDVTDKAPDTDEPTDTADTTAPEVDTGYDTLIRDDRGPSVGLDVSPVVLSAVTVADGAPVCLDRVTLCGDASDYADIITGMGLTVTDGGLPLRVSFVSLDGVFETGADEGYILRITPDGVSIQAESDRGAYYALMTLGQLVKNGTTVPAVSVKDAPAVASRGVIEGFYGTPWTPDFRLDLMAFMGERKMNTYIYAPKDDAKHRGMWRDTYNKEEREALQKLINTAADNRVRFVYAISPGVDIDLGGGYDKDFAKLCKKCEQLYELGARDFALLLDDIPTLDAEGHAKLLNDFQEKFIGTHEGVSDLIAITTEYTDPFLTDYTKRIAPLIDPSIRLMWTGPGVVCPSIGESDLRSINKTYKRSVFIWWNYPVNDVLVDHLYMGPCQGLEKTLSNSISGLVANPMNQGYASMIPLFTTADYLWNPPAYDKDASLAAAAAWLCPAYRTQLIDFVDTVGASPMNGNTSNARLSALLACYKSGETAVLDELIAECDRLCAVSDLRCCSHAAFVAEITPWLDKAEAYANMAALYFRMEKEYAGQNRPDIIMGLIGEYAEWAQKATGTQTVSPDVLTPFLSGLTARLNQLAGLTDSGRVTCLDARPVTNAATYQNYDVSRINDGDDSTYFWTAGAMWQAAAGTTGYVGLDFGRVSDIRNIYIATGENGGDVFTCAVIEYSSDGKKWQTLCEGPFSDVIYLTGLDIKARYLRMRNTDTSSPNWVKVRVFEANTDRTVPQSYGEFSVTTSLTAYQDNLPEHVTDGDGNTFFWSNRGVNAGDYIQIDLGVPSNVTRVTLETGVGGHTADYMEDGELIVSADGYVWQSVGKPGQGRAVYGNLGLTARYIRLVSRKNQTSWFTMSRFDVEYSPIDTGEYYTDTGFCDTVSVMRALDGDILTAFSPDAKAADGHTLTLDVAPYNAVTLLCPVFSDTVTVTLKDASGKTVGTYPLSARLTLDCQNATIAVIAFGNQPVSIAEIMRK